jgi:hypothetical protein
MRLLNGKYSAVEIDVGMGHYESVK